MNDITKFKNKLVIGAICLSLACGLVGVLMINTGLKSVGKCDCAPGDGGESKEQLKGIQDTLDDLKSKIDVLKANKSAATDGAAKQALAATGSSTYDCKLSYYEYASDIGKKNYHVIPVSFDQNDSNLKNALSRVGIISDTPTQDQLRTLKGLMCAFPEGHCKKKKTLFNDCDNFQTYCENIRKYLRFSWEDVPTICSSTDKLPKTICWLDTDQNDQGPGDWKIDPLPSTCTLKAGH